MNQQKVKQVFIILDPIGALLVVALRLFLSLDSFAAFTGRKPWSKVEPNNIRLDFLPSS